MRRRKSIPLEEGEVWSILCTVRIHYTLPWDICSSSAFEGRLPPVIRRTLVFE